MGEENRPVGNKDGSNAR